MARIVRGALVFAAIVFSILLVVKFSTTFSEVRSYKADFWSVDHYADCGLVLTGGPQRVREGLDLLARQQVRKLIISGVHPSATFAEIFPIHPFHGSVREDDVILERKSLTTFGNIQQSVPIIEALKCRDLVLVTSSLHMIRALKTLRAELPARIGVIPRAVWPGAERPGWFESAIETTKLLFYSTWAF